MLFYLDNWLSADPAAAERQQELQQQRCSAAAAAPDPARAQQAQQRRRGLNENYGRELLELHTLGVDGGYTQKDIIEVARAFTGWTIAPQNQKPGGQLVAPFRANGRRAQTGPRAVQEGEFRFAPMLHDTGEKIVLGHKIKAGGGIEDGEQVLDIVARHPATAHHIAFELAQRFVSDEPPKALVDRAAQEIPRHGRRPARSRPAPSSRRDEFFARRAARRSRRRSSSWQAPCGQPAATWPAMVGSCCNALMQMGMPLYMCQPPTGYDDTADTWVSAGALVARMNIAQRIARPQQAGAIGGPDFQRR